MMGRWRRARQAFYFISFVAQTSCVAQTLLETMTKHLGMTRKLISGPWPLHRPSEIAPHGSKIAPRRKFGVSSAKSAKLTQTRNANKPGKMGRKKTKFSHIMPNTAYCASEHK